MSQVPAKNWFDITKEIIGFAYENTNINDFKTHSAMRPYSILDNPSYRMDVLKQLLREDVIRIENNSLKIGSLSNLEWLHTGIENGHQDSWELVELIEGKTNELIKFDNKNLQKIGRKGELFIIEQLEKLLPKEKRDSIKHVSEYNDLVGYDIYSPSTKNSDNNFCLEVKTSVKSFRDDFHFYLSRNEFNVGRKSKNWVLAFVSIIDSIPTLCGYLYCYQIESLVPQDTNDNCRWESCSINVSKKYLRKGLP